jgi:streptogramin lyase
VTFGPTTSRRTFAAAAAALALAAAPWPAAGVSARYWIHDSAADFLEGKATGVSITSEGALRLAPRVETLAEPEAPYLWDVAVDARGRTFAGTGDEGWIVRVAAGKAEPFFQCAALEVLCLDAGSDGTLYAGTAPDGFVYRITAAGEGSILFDAPQAYVWDLALGPDGAVYAAAGPRAAIWRIDPRSGRAEEIATIDDNHVVSLAFDAQGRLLFGTEGRGLVGRVDGGRAIVLHDCAEGEVGAVASGPDGIVWVAASAPAEAREEATADAPDSTADGSASPDGATPEDEERDGHYLFRVHPDDEGKGVLYRIDADGNATRIWESGQGSVFDILPLPGGDVLALTGDEGRIVRVHPDGTATLLLDADEEHVVSAVRDPSGDGWIVACANPSRVLRVEGALRGKGTYESQVLDAGRLARWGRLDWTGEGSGASFAVRSGNTGKPDGTWSEWSGELHEAASELRVDGARFLQWRATLEGGGTKSPLVRRVRVSSLERNVAPVVSSVEVVPAGTRFYDEEPEARPRPLYQTLPGGVSVQYSLDNAPGKFPPEQRSPWTQGLRQIRWQAADPNGDALLFELSYRREDETEWKPFGEDVEGTTWTFNSNGVPDGPYAVRVTASDRRSNPYDEKTAWRDSEIFLIDNTPPAFRDVAWTREGATVRATGMVEDETSDVVRLETSVDGGDWSDQPPADGIFDARTERIDVRVEVEGKKEHSILLRGTDLAGNLSATRVLVK